MGVVHEFGIEPFTESAMAWLKAADERPAPTQPRLAATVMLTRGEPLEVFMIERAHTMDFAPSVWVFPGGGLDAADGEVPLSRLGLGDFGLARWSARAGADVTLGHRLVVAALRELFEEAGVLLASNADGVIVDSRTDAWRATRHAVESHEARFVDVIDGLTLRGDLIEVVDRWVTPEFERRRFDAWFFTALLPEGAEAEAVSRESQSGRWVRPEDMLAEFEAGHVRLLPPTLTALRRLSRASSAEEALEQARAAGTPHPTHPLPHLGPDGPFLRAEVNL